MLLMSLLATLWMMVRTGLSSDRDSWLFLAGLLRLQGRRLFPLASARGFFGVRCRRSRQLVSSAGGFGIICTRIFHPIPW